MKPRVVLKTALLGGAVAGVLDLAAAFILHGLNLRVVQAIAGGLLGRAAYEGGLKTAALGIVLHFLIATTVAGVYGAAAVRWPLLTRRALRCGLVYGLGVYLVMYGLVLPLSALRFYVWNQPATTLLAGILIHLFCVGLPVALLARRITETTQPR